MKKLLFPFAILVFFLSISLASASICPSNLRYCNPNLPFINPSETTVSGNLTTFLELTDTPNSYAGQAGLCLKVNGGETYLEFGDCGTGGGMDYTNIALINQTNIFTKSQNFSQNINVAYNMSFSDTIAMFVQGGDFIVRALV